MKKRLFPTVYLAATILISACGPMESQSSPEPDLAFLTSTFTFSEPVSKGTVFYIDPDSGSSAADGGNGSSETPWKSLQQVIEEGLVEHYAYSESYNTDSALIVQNEGAPVKGGDTLLLKEGYHGHIDLNRFIFRDWLTIKGASGETAILSRINLNGAIRKIYLTDFSIIKESYTLNESPGENYWEVSGINGSGLYLGTSSFWGDCREIKVRNLTIKTAEDSSGWSATDWASRAGGGIGLRSTRNVEIADCTIENVGMGISIEYHSDYTWCVNNSINNYSVDGARIISDHVYFADNIITNCYDVDDNHDDGIQSYSRGSDNSVGTGYIEHVLIRGNTIIDSTDPSNTLAGSPQGIGCFDGFFRFWRVENNMIVSNTYHGISLYGAVGCEILNNTVVDSNPSDTVSPWIMIHDHKNGTASAGCRVANNIAASSISADANQTVHNNFVINSSDISMEDLFIDPSPQNLDYNFHLIDTQQVQDNLVDKGYAVPNCYSAVRDLDGNLRTGSPDIGAYEL